MKKIKLKIKKWFINTYLKRYLITIDNSILSIFTKEQEKVFYKASIYDAEVEAKREKILKILSSKKYKKYFFKAVNYKINNSSDEIKPFGNNLIDKINKIISVIYLRLFNNKLYESIKLFEKWKSKISTIEDKVDNYMKTTTLDERIDRSIALGTIDNKKGTAQKRMRNIQKIRVENILEQNKL